MSEMAFMELSEKYIYEIQMILRSKKILEQYALIRKAMDIEEILYTKVRYDNCLDQSKDLWTHKEAIKDYQNKLEKMKKSIRDKDLDWEKLFKENAQKIVNALNQEGISRQLKRKEPIIRTKQSGKKKRSSDHKSIPSKRVDNTRTKILSTPLAPLAPLTTSIHPIPISNPIHNEKPLIDEDIEEDFDDFFGFEFETNEEPIIVHQETSQNTYEMNMVNTEQWTTEHFEAQIQDCDIGEGEKDLNWVNAVDEREDAKLRLNVISRTQGAQQDMLRKTREESLLTAKSAYEAKIKEEEIHRKKIDQEKIIKEREREREREAQRRQREQAKATVDLHHGHADDDLEL
eukprot:CAMPEP_0182429766 /NCGR_PEP_ID=MMETSP1167-20130531/33612_1 /TAXON_ID=2988 /ORGANISM="Mallomonas Sp, Strain CCMP3275" /LENGTH=344 /DNA_ID=CAMNT_0024613977 /DNA_START=41 /DNA_END=1075 /DNA_ORIENTATION=+